MLKQLEHLKEFDAAHLSTLFNALTDPDKDIRLYALKVAREWSCSENSRIINKVQLLLVNIFTLDQNKHASEREMALKFTRTIINLKVFPKSVLRVLVAIAENPEDKLRFACIETLCEISVLHPKAAFECNVIKLLFLLLLDGPKEMSDGIVWTILYLLDSDKTRIYIRPNVELEMIASYFTDSYGSSVSGNDERLAACSRILCHLMKSWTGLIYLSPQNNSTLSAIVQSLTLPSQTYRNLLLSTFHEILRLSNENYLLGMSTN
jgi:rapamycin-insensitive companion of mTOR